MMPGPNLPNPNIEQGRQQLVFSMMTCAQQIDPKTFAYMQHIRPRRALIVDEQKGWWALFRCSSTTVRAGAPRGMRPLECCKIWSRWKRSPSAAD